MQHRDYVVIRKIIENIDMGIDFLGSMSFDDFCEKKEGAICSELLLVK